MKVCTSLFKYVCLFIVLMEFFTPTYGLTFCSYYSIVVKYFNIKVDTLNSKKSNSFIAIMSILAKL